MVKKRTFQPHFQAILGLIILVSFTDLSAFEPNPIRRSIAQDTESSPDSNQANEDQGGEGSKEVQETDTEHTQEKILSWRDLDLESFRPTPEEAPFIMNLLSRSSSALELYDTLFSLKIEMTQSHYESLHDLLSGEVSSTKTRELISEMADYALWDFWFWKSRIELLDARGKALILNERERKELQKEQGLVQLFYRERESKKIVSFGSVGLRTRVRSFFNYEFRNFTSSASFSTSPWAGVQALTKEIIKKKQEILIEESKAQVDKILKRDDDKSSARSRKIDQMRREETKLLNSLNEIRQKYFEVAAEITEELKEKIEGLLPDEVPHALENLASEMKNLKEKKKSPFSPLNLLDLLSDQKLLVYFLNQGEEEEERGIEESESLRTTLVQVIAEYNEIKGFYHGLLDAKAHVSQVEREQIVRLMEPMKQSDRKEAQTDRNIFMRDLIKLAWYEIWQEREGKKEEGQEQKKKEPFSVLTEMDQNELKSLKAKHFLPDPYGSMINFGVDPSTMGDGVMEKVDLVQSLLGEAGLNTNNPTAEVASSMGQTFKEQEPKFFRRVKEEIRKRSYKYVKHFKEEEKSWIDGLFSFMDETDYIDIWLHIEYLHRDYDKISAEQEEEIEVRDKLLARRDEAIKYGFSYEKIDQDVARSNDKVNQEFANKLRKINDQLDEHFAQHEEFFDSQYDLLERKIGKIVDKHFKKMVREREDLMAKFSREKEYPFSSEIFQELIDDEKVKAYIGFRSYKENASEEDKKNKQMLNLFLGIDEKS